MVCTFDFSGCDRSLTYFISDRLQVFRALVGHIPPNPLWAELVWQRQNEMAKSPSQGPSQTRVAR